MPIRSRVETITPAKAKTWLAEHNAENRNLRKAWVSKLAEAMRRGEWQVTHQGIAFDDDGVLLDGQHRLAAVTEAGKSVQMLVSRGVPAEAYDTLDTGRARTAGDVLKAHGYTDTNIVAAATRCFIAYHEAPPRQNWGTRNAYGQVTTPQTLTVLADTPELLEAGPAASRVSAEVGRYGLRSGLCTVFVIIAKHAPQTWEKLGSDFVEALATGMNLGPGSPILAWRRTMINYSSPSSTSRRRSVPAQLTVALTLQAWNAWVTGAPRQRAHFRLGMEPMPRVAALADLDPGEDDYRMRVTAEMEPLDSPDRTDHEEPEPTEAVE